MATRQKHIPKIICTSFVLCTDSIYDVSYKRLDRKTPQDRSVFFVRVLVRKLTKNYDWQAGNIKFKDFLEPDFLR